MSNYYIPEGFGLATLLWSVTGDDDRMSCSFGISVADDPDDPDHMATETRLAYADVWSSTNGFAPWRFDGVHVLLRFDGTLLEGEDLSTPITYVGGTTSLPSNCALLMAKRTGLAGRRNRGRLYFPSFILNETQVDANGRWLSTNQADHQARADDFLDNLANLGTSNTPMYLLHRPTEADPTPDATLVTSLYVPDKIATQRRRMRPS